MLKLFRAVMPKEVAFFDMFERHSATLVGGAEVMARMFAKEEGIEEACRQISQFEEQADQVRAMFPEGPQFNDAAEQLKNPSVVSDQLFRMPRLFLFAIGMVVAVKDAFRMSLARALAVEPALIETNSGVRPAATSASSRWPRSPITRTCSA